MHDSCQWPNDDEAVNWAVPVDAQHSALCQLLKMISPERHRVVEEHIVRAESVQEMRRGGSDPAHARMCQRGSCRRFCKHSRADETSKRPSPADAASGCIRARMRCAFNITTSENARSRMKYVSLRRPGTKTVGLSIINWAHAVDISTA